MADEKPKNIVKLTNVRLAFPQIFEPKSFQGEGKAMYSASFLINPKTQKALIVELETAIREAAKLKWGAKADAVLKALKAADKTFLHDGNGKADYDGFADMLYVAARKEQRPLVIDRDKSPLTSEDGRPYGGCFVNTSIDIWAQDNGFGKRINAGLRGIQFVKDGDAFSGSTPVSDDEFEEVADDEGELA